MRIRSVELDLSGSVLNEILIANRFFRSAEFGCISVFKIGWMHVVIIQIQQSKVDKKQFNSEISKKWLKHDLVTAITII